MTSVLKNKKIYPCVSIKLVILDVKAFFEIYESLSSHLFSTRYMFCNKISQSLTVVEASAPSISMALADVRL